MFPPILQLEILNLDHLDLSIVMNANIKLEWLESGLVDNERLNLNMGVEPNFNLNNIVNKNE